MTANSIQKKHKPRRTLSLLLAVRLLLQTIVYIPSASAASSAEFAGQVLLGSAALAQTQTLTDNGNGSYTLDITLDPGLVHTDYNTESGVSQNQCFTAQYSGYYLVELWGGDGGKGSDTSVCQGGTGGQGGHVYGKVFLNAGETLYYQLGGDGIPTDITDAGGGANGEGGGHGDQGSLEVGGGGGYSALYKFAPAEFEQTYTDGSGNLTADDISEADRTSKYIMIAGGGGGGGAGDGWSIFGDDPVGTADGGAGGSLSSASGQLTGAGYAVEGTYYVGADGKSSGTDTEYVGRGGSNVPGTISDTITTLIKGKQPNDWEGAANPDTEGGAGGSGNMRGGAGGAGYCGGSGAVMTSLVSTYNIGGGGGGSSFIASSVMALTAEEQAKLGSNASTTGGGVHIAYLSGQDFSYLENLTLSVGLSQYMTISSASASSGTWTGSSLTGMNLLEGPVTVSFKLQAATGFAGGNNVPLFDAGITCATTESTPTTAAVALGDDCSYVNVPLSGFEVDVQNYTTNVEGKEYLLSSLYLGRYTDFDPDAPFGNADDAWKYAFIDSIDAYTVDGSAVDADDTVTVNETTAFAVGITVNPLDKGVAAVGEQVTATTFTKDATITILASGGNDLNGNAVTYYKELSHDGTNYILTLHTDISSDLTASATSKTVTTTGTLDEYTISTPGYYYIQVWGGDGGNGYDNGGTAGAGGAGGYVSGYIYLADGNQLTGTIAANGNDATGNEETTVSTGGGFSQVNLKASESAEETPLMIAGGGGGGGNGGSTWYFITTSKLTGGTGASVDNDDISETISNHVGGNGKVGKEGTFIFNDGYAGDGGSAGANYRSTTMKTDPAADTTLTADQKTKFAEKIEALGTEKPSTAAAGAIVITPLELESADQAEIADYNINTQLSDYFVLDGTPESAISYGDGNGDEEGGVYTDDTHAITYSYTSIDNGGNNLIQLSGIDPVVTTTTTTTTDENGQVSTQTVRTASFTVSFKLKPRDEFLGGNDVPVIVVKSDTDTGMSMQYTQYGTPLNIDANPQVDNANVTIPADNDWANDAFVQITEPAPTITAGESVTRTPGLYEVTDDAAFDGSTWATDADWRNDFVEPQIVLTKQADGTEVTEDPLAPITTTKYIVATGLAPTKTEGVQAICLPQVEAAASPGQEAIIYVVPRVIYQLNNLETSDTNGIWDGDEYTVTVQEGVDYTATLTAKSGYKLPDSVTVLKNGETVTSGYTYNASTGVITLTAALLGTNAITIQADGGEAEHNIYYVYEVSPGVATGATTETYKEGASLSGAFHKTHSPATFEHYEFMWSWETDDGKEPTVMPAKNIYAIGTYVPKEYTLVVRYLDADTDAELATSTGTKVRYGKDYTVTPVEVAGYKPTATVINGTMQDDTDGTITDGKKTVTFYYEAITGKLDITYVYGDTHETISSVSQAIQAGGSYSVTSPTIEGYTPDIPVVSVNGVTAEQVASGISVTVTYSPNDYTVTFDPNGGTVGESSRQVVFNNTYNYYYDAEKDQYVYGALPKPIRSGDGTKEYAFQGWYLNGTEITDASQVTTAGDHTLVAQWEEATPAYILTIKYVYEDGTTATETVQQKVKYGEAYEVASPAIANYTPDIDPVSGTMGAANKLVTVTYISNYHTLTIHYVFADSGDKAAEDHVQNYLKGDTYSVDSPAVTVGSDTYTATPATVSGTMGTEDIVVTVYYTKTGPVVSVTVTWGELDFVYDYGTWVPETHTYSVEPINPVNQSANYVTVTNNVESNIPIKAQLNYAVDPAFDVYADIDGYFTETDSRAGRLVAETPTLQPTETDTVYFWLQGTMEAGKSGTLTSGTCTVTITGGG